MITLPFKNLKLKFDIKSNRWEFWVEKHLIENLKRDLNFRNASSSTSLYYFMTYQMNVILE